MCTSNNNAAFSNFWVFFHTCTFAIKIEIEPTQFFVRWNLSFWTEAGGIESETDHVQMFWHTNDNCLMLEITAAIPGTAYYIIGNNYYIYIIRLIFDHRLCHLIWTNNVIYSRKNNPLKIPRMCPYRELKAMMILILMIFIPNTR